MRLLSLMAVAAVLAAAVPAAAQDRSSTLEPTWILALGVEHAESPIGVDFEPVVISHDGGQPASGRAFQARLGWQAGNESASRLQTRDARGAASVRVIRACELSLRLGDEDCAAN